MTKDELIAALEKATGPDRELDYVIAGLLPWKEDPDRIMNRRTMFYTRDIDAALTLVPEGFWWDMSYGVKVGHSGSFWASVYSQFNASGWEVPGDPFVYPGANPAIAICIATLKARTND